MNAWVLAWLIYYLRTQKRWSWVKIVRTTAVGIGYLVVGRVIACCLSEVA